MSEKAGRSRYGKRRSRAVRNTCRADGETANRADGETTNRADGEIANRTDGETANRADGETANRVDGETANRADGETMNRADGETMKRADGEKMLSPFRFVPKYSYCHGIKAQIQLLPLDLGQNAVTTIGFGPKCGN